MAKYTYWIETKLGGKWGRIPFSENKKSWCEGYCAAIDDRYPSPEVRLMRSDGKIEQESGGNGTVGGS